MHANFDSLCFWFSKPGAAMRLREFLLAALVLIQLCGQSFGGDVAVWKAASDCYLNRPTNHLFPAKCRVETFELDFAADHAGRSLLGAADVTIPVEEVDVLIAFKRRVTNDPLGALQMWGSNASNACSWTGVTCSPEAKRIVGLDLASFQLEGQIGDELGNFQSLQHLNLSSNLFTGSIPASIVNCADLSFLDLSSNLLTGVIPAQIGDLQKVTHINFSRNKITGTIPQSLGNCTLLGLINLSHNDLDGDIPPVLGKLSHLQFLNLNSNSFSGSLPSELGNCSSLRYLTAEINVNLGGELSPELGRLKNLEYFAVGKCNFRGYFPAWVSNFTRMITLSLRGNQFVGDIPLEVVGNFEVITGLALDQNLFRGAIPTSIFNCTTLTYISLDQNNLSGEIDPRFGSLVNLQVLRLQQNNLAGVIPSSLSNCTGLKQLVLGFNPQDAQDFPVWIPSLGQLENLVLARMNLQGPIPPKIGQLSNLNNFLVYENNLTGTIPSSLGNCTSMQVLNLRSNQLHGKIPSEIGVLWQLSDLQIANNSFSGSFPAFVANLSKLVVLDVQLNLLRGKIDGDFGRMEAIQLLAISVNKFSGGIPATLFNCSTLTNLRLGGNFLGGRIPPSLGNLTSLEYLDLSFNSFEGEIPVDLLRCTRLSVIDFEFNNIEGNIPWNIGDLDYLDTLRLSNNFLTGSLPTSLGNCTLMSNLNVSENRLSGNVPGISISKITSLQSLDLSGNLFSGSWPRELSLLINIQFINISANNISGSIPPGTLGRCTSLISLDISNNNLSGNIPGDLGSLKLLQFFNASYNDFRGPIPDTGYFNTSATAGSFIGNPELCGRFLAHRCPSATLEPSEVGSRSFCKRFQCKHIIWVVLVVLLCASIVLAVTCRAVAYKVLHCDVPPGRHGVETLVGNMRITERDVLITIGGEDNIIGVGISSTVYKGVSIKGKPFAIKVLMFDHTDEHALQKHEVELLKEVHILVKLRHRNILKVLGFYSTATVKGLILEYMPEGTLEMHLHHIAKAGKLTWAKRFRIAMGVAHGMVYLHHDFPEPIIHRDLKPGNILLDENMEPRICDFGISKAVSVRNQGDTFVSKFCGTIGYIPPEYGTGSRVSTKGDVYSYGILLLQLLTGRNASYVGGVDDLNESSGSLLGWVKDSFQRGPTELFDATLVREESPSRGHQHMMLLMRVALLCTREDPRLRPSMDDVLGMLMQIEAEGLIVVNIVEDMDNEGNVPNTVTVNKTCPLH